jgi:hypothetical protein
MSQDTRRDGRWSSAAIVPALVVVLLASVALTQTIGRFGETIGIDYYHFWGVGMAKRLDGRTLGTPYGDGARYETVLRQYGEMVRQPRLRAVQRFWTAPDFTASPLLYRAFSVASDDYTLSLAVFRAIQAVAFVGAGLLLGALLGLGTLHVAALLLVASLVYQPLLSDLRVANLGALQFAALVGALALTSALSRARAFAGRVALTAAVLVTLGALALCKPNVVLVCLALAACLALRQGPKLFGLAVLPALLGIAALLVVPCLYFGSWTVWQEWYRFVYGSNARMLVRSIESGNYATPLVVSSWVGANVFTVSLVVAALLAGSLLVIVRPASSVLAAAGSALRRLFGDPHAAVALGVLVTTAVSPLWWVHYDMLLLLPTFWLLAAPAGPPAVPLLAALSMIMSAGVVGILGWALGWAGAIPATIALSWVPLWAALLIELRSPEPVAPAATATQARGARRRKPVPAHG